MISRPRRIAHEEEASLVEHLDELRSRLVVAGGAVLLGSIAGYVVHRQALRLLISALPRDTGTCSRSVSSSRSRHR